MQLVCPGRLGQRQLADSIDNIHVYMLIALDVARNQWIESSEGTEQLVMSGTRLSLRGGGGERRAA